MKTQEEIMEQQKEIIKHFKELLEIRNIKPESEKGMNLQFWYLSGVYAAIKEVPAYLYICQATGRSIVKDLNQLPNK